MTPKYPIYIISKGRYDTRLTQKALEKMNLDYHIVVEPQEYQMYAEHVPREKIKILPFSNLGQGGIPARNWVWRDSIERGFKRHWILDDNIGDFRRLSNNKKTILLDGTGFRAIEEYVDAFENVPIAGMQYVTFAQANTKYNAHSWNTRIYSCILIENSLNHRWRGRYNEDTDLSLRVLKDGKCTLLSNEFLCFKRGTMTMKGGNEALYIQNQEVDGRLLMAQHLWKQHPDVVSIKQRWGRYQHVVDYRPFRNNKPIRKQGIELPVIKLVKVMNTPKIEPTAE